MRRAKDSVWAEGARDWPAARACGVRQQHARIWVAGQRARRSPGARHTLRCWIASPLCGTVAERVRRGSTVSVRKKRIGQEAQERGCHGSLGRGLRLSRGARWTLHCIQGGKKTFEVPWCETGWPTDLLSHRAANRAPQRSSSITVLAAPVHYCLHPTLPCRERSGSR